MYIPSIFHFSIFTNPYSTFVYPMKSPGNPHENIYETHKTVIRAYGQGLRPRPVPAPQKTDGTCCEKRSTASTGEKRGPQHGMHGSCLTDGLVMIGYDWVCLKKMAIIKKNWHLNPPSVMEIPMWGAQITWYFCCQMEYQGWRQLSGRSMSCCLDDPTAYILWFS